jgi:hypothetical protein
MIWFIIGAAAAVVTAGLGYGAHEEAKSINRKAEKIVNNVDNERKQLEQDLARASSALEEGLRDFGYLKENAVNIVEQVGAELNEIVIKQGWSEIHNVIVKINEHVLEVKSAISEFKKLAGDDPLKAAIITGGAALTTSVATSLITGTATAATTSALLGTAGISAIEGAAALSLGAAGGAAASLGALVPVLAPALALGSLAFGITENINAEKNLTKAKEYKADVSIWIEKAKAQIDVWQRYLERVSILSTSLNELTNNLIKEISLPDHKTNWSTNSERVVAVISICWAIIQILQINLEMDADNFFKLENEIQRTIDQWHY